MEVTKQLKKSEKKYKLIIPNDVELKIRYLCSKISQVEWSGYIFYTHKGKFEDDSIVFTIKDLMIQNIGNTTYTSFNRDNEQLCEYMALNYLMDTQIGMIHSHNNMTTFFSNTDLKQLEDGGKDQNIFLSLIVNNAGVYTAAITRQINRTLQYTYSFNSFNNETIKGNYSEKTTDDIILYNILDVDIQLNDYFKELDDLYSTVKINSAKAITTKITIHNDYKNYQVNKKGKSNYKGTLFDSYESQKINNLTTQYYNKKNKNEEIAIENKRKEEKIIIEDLELKEIAYKILKQILVISPFSINYAEKDYNKWFKKFIKEYVDRAKERWGANYTPYLNEYLSFTIENIFNNDTLLETYSNEDIIDILQYLDDIIAEFIDIIYKDNEIKHSSKIPLEKILVNIKNSLNDAIEVYTDFDVYNTNYSDDVESMDYYITE